MRRPEYGSRVIPFLLMLALLVYMGRNVLAAAVDSPGPSETKRMEVVEKTIREQEEGDARIGREVLKRAEAQPDYEKKIAASEEVMSEEEMPLAAEVKVREYQIGLNDVLDISVWQFPELSREVTVRPDGRISFPLIGDMQALGLTITQFDDEITKRLNSYAKEQLKNSRLQEYQIGLNDVLDISVWQFPELSREVAVRPDGRISFPLVGDMQAIGKTTIQLGKEINNKLILYVREPQVSVIVKKSGSRKEDVILAENPEVLVSIKRSDSRKEETILVKDPEVSISIKKLGGKKIIVLGQVNSPGVYSVTGASTLLEAIGLAGGFTNNAVSSSVVLIRRGFTNPEAKRINLTNVVKGDLTQNLALEAEDIVFIPKRFIADLNYFLSQVLDPIVKGIYTAREIRSW